MIINYELENKLLEQPFTESLENEDDYLLMAVRYAKTENSIAVLSDMKSNTSYVCCGKLGELLGIGNNGAVIKINSIWEELIFSKIHPDDLSSKFLDELRFYHFIMKISPEKRSDYYLCCNLRMKDCNNKYLNISHRMFYINYDATGSARLSLCLYNLSFDDANRHIIFNSLTSETIALENFNCKNILSSREIEIIQLIEQGYKSKDIAEKLSISINTVNRHRQNILFKLHANNSIEACTKAKSFNII
jgi:DNA-binding CsgD family transcriptional regulator